MNAGLRKKADVDDEFKVFSFIFRSKPPKKICSSRCSFSPSVTAERLLRAGPMIKHFSAEENAGPEVIYLPAIGCDQFNKNPAFEPDQKFSLVISGFAMAIYGVQGCLGILMAIYGVSTTTTERKRKHSQS